jgi:putative ABC transport system ATP-binding protein
LTESHWHEPHTHDPRGRAEAMLELRNLVKHYPTLGGEPVRAVDGVSLTVRAGEMIALYGPSGSGKTTLLLMIATLLAPTSGTVLIGGREASLMSEREASRFRLTELGFIRQSFDLLPGVSAIDNAILKLLGAMRWRQAQREIEPLLVRLGLGERLRHRSETLSMGERQRVMIARALSTDPRLLLADEPTGSLDTQRGREVLELLRELCREREVAVVLVSHDPMAAHYADRVLALRDGRLGDYNADHDAGGKFDGSLGAPGHGRADANATAFTTGDTVDGTRSPPASVTRP